MKPGVGEEVVDRECSLVVLTGAGVSAESGLPTFRGMGGLWQGFRVEEVASPEAFCCREIAFRALGGGGLDALRR